MFWYNRNISPETQSSWPFSSKEVSAILVVVELYMLVNSTDICGLPRCQDCFIGGVAKVAQANFRLQSVILQVLAVISPTIA